ncbi:MAG: SUMF1/EgtB/PvdO family nonheme iron enzyme [Planctomyces sp.]
MVQRLAWRLPVQPAHGSSRASSGSFRVLLGGSWVGGPNLVRCALRNSITPEYRVFNYGFRLVLE